MTILKGIEAAAAVLKMSATTLIRHLKNGVPIPHKQIGMGKRPRRYFIKEQLEEYLREGPVVIDYATGKARRAKAERKAA